MEKSTKRGKIPQSDWPSIMARYETGETLSSIARTYDCSPPAISYVVSRSRARQPGVTAPAAGEPEGQLVKTAGQPSPPAAATSPASPALSSGASAAAAERQPAPLAHSAPLPHSNPVPHPNPVPNGAAATGDARRTLHLSLGGAPGNGSVSRIVGEARRASADASGSAPGQPPVHGGPSLSAAITAPPASEIAEEARVYQAAQTHNGNGAANGAGGTGAAGNGAALFIDRDLRARVDGDIATFLAAFDAALLQDSQESRARLREATDRLLRAGARTRIELERLEARMPLPPRDQTGRGAADWRHRY